MAARKRDFGEISSLGDGDESYETATDVSRFLREEKRKDSLKDRDREIQRQRERETTNRETQIENVRTRPPSITSTCWQLRPSH